MPLDDIAGSLLGGFFRFLIWLMAELFFETLVKGTGHIVLSILRPNKEPSETACAWVGVAVWVMLVVIALMIFRASVG